MNKPGVFVLYSIPAPADWLEAKWNAGECLTYVGGFVAALAAVVGIYATISESRLSEERQPRESVAPCIALTLLKIGFRLFKSLTRKCSVSTFRLRMVLGRGDSLLSDHELFLGRSDYR